MKDKYIDLFILMAKNITLTRIVIKFKEIVIYYKVYCIKLKMYFNGIRYNKFFL